MHVGPSTTDVKPSNLHLVGAETLGRVIAEDTVDHDLLLALAVLEAVRIGNEINNETHT